MKKSWNEKQATLLPDRGENLDFSLHLSEDGAFNAATIGTFPDESRELNVMGTFVLIAHFQQDRGSLCAAVGRWSDRERLVVRQSIQLKDLRWGD